MTLIYKLLWFLIVVAFLPASVGASEDNLIADFETDSYGDWQVTGTAFGDGPVQGTLAGQMDVSGYEGQRLVNSFHGGDASTGELTSPVFTINRPFINLLVGGGGYPGETEVQLLVDGKVVRTANGPNLQSGGSEALVERSWGVESILGEQAQIKIVDSRTGGWGHINVDQIRQADERSAATFIQLEKELLVDDGYLLVPIANYSQNQNAMRLNLYDGDTLIQNLDVSMPVSDDPYWTAAYPLEHFGVAGKRVTIRSAHAAMSTTAVQPAFDKIRIGSQDAAWSTDDYDQPYRNQFHISTRRGWNNDPNGMVYHNGKYHLYYQYNPFGIFWGNMHWGHFVSEDLVHWSEEPIALYQKTVGDMMFSGGGFVDHNNTAGYGDNVLFVAFTSTGRGECLAYSQDDGQTFTEIPENPVVKHSGRDPKIIWYEPQQKWVMVVYNDDENELTRSTPFLNNSSQRKNANLAFYESKDLHHWIKTGVFTDPDRNAVYECPEFFELPVEGQSDGSRWCLMGASNRYFIGTFDGHVFHKESGPHGDDRGAFYAPQTFSDTPHGRRIQIGWVRTSSFEKAIPDQMVNQCFTLPHEMKLHQTAEGLRIFCTPVEELKTLRVETLAHATDIDSLTTERILNECKNALTEVQIELDAPAKVHLRINGIPADFDGKTASIFNDRVTNEVYVDHGRIYEVNARGADSLADTSTTLRIDGQAKIKSITVYRLQSIF